MISSTLTRIERAACESCNAFAPDCMMPVDDNETIAVCWICAHMVTVHEHAVGESITACTCAEADIYPPDIAELRQLRRARKDAAALGKVLDRDQVQLPFAAQPEYVGRHSKRWLDMKRMGTEHGDDHSKSRAPLMSSTATEIASMNRAQVEVMAREGVETMRTLTPAQVAERDRGFVGSARSMAYGSRSSKR